MSSHTFTMEPDGYYGIVKLPDSVFQKLDPELFISSCTDTKKFMCANQKEKLHLQSLGVIVIECCDWYKILLTPNNDT